MTYGCTPPVSSKHWGAPVTVGGTPATGDVLFVNGKGAVVADVPIVNGRYDLPTAPIASYAMFRLESPAIGTREVQLRDDAPPPLNLETTDAVNMRASIDVPDGVTFDWVDVELTPTRGSLSRDVRLWSGQPGAPRSAMFKRHLTVPGLELRLLRDTYVMAVSRIPDRTQADPGPTLVLEGSERGIKIYQIETSFRERLALRRVR